MSLAEPAQSAASLVVEPDERAVVHLEAVASRSGRLEVPAFERGVVSLPVGALRPGFSARARKVDVGHVELLAGLEGKWPPILVTHPGCLIVDGHHRYQAAVLLGYREIAGVYYAGDSESAFVESVRLNTSHGKPLTMAERRVAAERIVRARREWSDRRLGEICGLSPRTIARVRAAGQGCPSEDSARLDTRLGRDGRAHPANPRSLREQVVNAIRSDPGASLRSIAQSARASHETVRKVRRELTSELAAGSDTVASGASTAETGVVGADLDLSCPAVVGSGDEHPRWSSIAAFASTPEFANLAGWLDRSSIDGRFPPRSFNVPLSYVYQVADEARRRSEYWADVANVLEYPGRPTRSHR
jgi:ParB-like chromosome segregation protein Spo0J